MAQQKPDPNQTTTSNQQQTSHAQRGELRRAPGPGRGLDRGPQVIGSPLAFTRRFLEDMDQLFDEFFGGGSMASLHGARPWGEQAFWSPQIEMFQRDSDLVIRADLPGVKKDDVKVELNEDALTIEGRREEHREEHRGGIYHNERSFGTFHRTIPLPEGVIGESADATFKDGVLEVVMQAPPTHQEKPGRRLEIKGGDSRDLPEEKKH